MIDSKSAHEVEEAEWLARYIVYKDHVRANGTVRPDAFIPHPYPNLSVTRHLSLGDDMLWMIGQDIAEQRGKTLCGRADLQAMTCTQQHLRIEADPTEGNPNHANVAGWPASKPEQKIIAMKLAASSNFLRHSN